jgi:LmbE family N-acetylglucosaminyl deacetylase
VLSAFSRVLVLAPHTDDGELGAGGLISKLNRAGVAVNYVAFSAAEESVPQGLAKDVLRGEVIAATRELGVPEENVRCLHYPVRKFGYSRQEILEDMVAIRKQLDPDLVLIPSLRDIHQDHGVVANEGLRAFKRSCVLAYELPWNNLDFSATCFVSLEEGDVDRKVAALGQYVSQAGRDYMSAQYIRSQAVFRGVQVGKSFAEAYEVLRWHIP